MADITPRTPRRTSRRAHPSSCLCDTVLTSSPNVSPKRCFRPTPLKKAATPRGGFCRESGRGFSLRRPRCPCPRPRFSRPARTFKAFATIANCTRSWPRSWSLPIRMLLLVDYDSLAFMTKAFRHRVPPPPYKRPPAKTTFSLQTWCSRLIERIE